MKTPRRKTNKYEDFVTPERTLDFHGKGVLQRSDIRKMCQQFITESLAEGCTRLLIITGKGIHSENEPVVKRIVEEELALDIRVQSHKRARRDRGGDGAFEVLLKQRI